MVFKQCVQAAVASLCLAFSANLALAQTPAAQTSAVHTPGAPPPSPAAPAWTVPTDPAVVQGRLPNGLRYAILKNARPKNSMSIRLRIDTGSFEEDEADRGIAHFLEHMAFNGTRRFPEGELTRRFAASGVAFGRDQNASTNGFTTQYQLEMSSTNRAHLTLAFDWLRDVADGQLFNPAAVDRERGVVMAEYVAGLGAGKNWRETYEAFAVPELRGPKRRAIGERETIAAITPERLSAFYHRWYRPDNAVLVVVGDFSPAVVERMIAERFGDWTAPNEPMQRAEGGAPNPDRPADVLIRTEASQGSVVSACRLSPMVSRGGDTLDRRRTYINRSLWQSIVARRMARLAQGENAPFTAAGLSLSGWPREAEAICLNVTPRADDRWAEGFTAAITELRRMEAHGVTQEEIERAVSAQKQVNANAIASRETRNSSSLVGDLLGSQSLYGFDPVGFVHPTETARVYDQLAPGFTPQTVSDAFRASWTGSGPLISVSMPAPPSADAVRAVWDAAMVEPTPDASAKRDQNTWAYDSFGSPGVVVSREAIRRPEFTRLRFNNGLVLNLKARDFTKDNVLIQAVFGAGRRELPDDKAMTAALGQSLFLAGGLGRHSNTEIGDIFPTRRLGAALGSNNENFTLSATTRPVDLQTELQLLAGLVSDPGFRNDTAALIPVAVENVYRGVTSQPGAMASMALSNAIAPGGQRSMPPKAAMMAVTMSDFEQMFRPALTQAPIELTIVGDIDEAATIAMVASTFGALPARENADRAKPDTWYLRYPESLAPIEAQHQGPADQAALVMVWPLYVASPNRRHEEYALQLLRGVVANAVRDRVREQLGAAYSPSVSLSMPDFADQGSLSVMISTSPDQVEAVKEAVIEVVAGLANGGVTQAALNEVRRPMQLNLRDTRRANSWWIGAMSGSAQDPQSIVDALAIDAAYRRMKSSDLQAAATAWLSRAPLIAIALPASRPASREAAPIISPPAAPAPAASTPVADETAH